MSLPRVMPLAARAVPLSAESLVHWTWTQSALALALELKLVLGLELELVLGPQLGMLGLEFRPVLEMESELEPEPEPALELELVVKPRLAAVAMQLGGLPELLAEQE